jgi:hypothetical protein
MITKFDIHELFPNSKTINTHRDITTYHGSKKWFEDFDFKKLGLNTDNDYLSNLGFHFTKSKRIAKIFTNPSEGGQILTVYLHLNKTLKLTEHQLVLGIVKYGIAKGYDYGYDYEYLKNLPYYNPEAEDSLYDNLENMPQNSNIIVRNFKKNILLRNGYDSIEYMNQIETKDTGDEKRYDFIALKPEVIEVDLQKIHRF